MEVSIEANRGTELIIQMTSQRFSTKVSGTVIGDYTGSPKPGLTVMILNPDGSDSDLKTTTSSSGYYQLPTVPQGERTIVVKVSDKIVFQADIFLADADYPFDIAIFEDHTEKFEDSRDGNTYEYKTIGTQTWMIENLAYLPSVSPSSSGSDPSPYLKGCLIRIRQFIHDELLLELNPKKTYFQHYSHGAKFLGTYILPYRTYISRRTKSGFINTITSQMDQFIHTPEQVNLSDSVSQINSYLGLLQTQQLDLYRWLMYDHLWNRIQIFQS